MEDTYPLGNRAWGFSIRAASNQAVRVAEVGFKEIEFLKVK
jgi:hypothetical protein